MSEFDALGELADVREEHRIHFDNYREAIAHAEANPDGHELRWRVEHCEQMLTGSLRARGRAVVHARRAGVSRDAIAEVLEVDEATVQEMLAEPSGE